MSLTLEVVAGGLGGGVLGQVRPPHRALVLERFLRAATPFGLILERYLELFEVGADNPEEEVEEGQGEELALLVQGEGCSVQTERPFQGRETGHDFIEDKHGE